MPTAWRQWAKHTLTHDEARSPGPFSPFCQPVTLIPQTFSPFVVIETVFIFILLENVALSCILAHYITVTKCFLRTSLCNTNICESILCPVWQQTTCLTLLALFTCHHYLLFILWLNFLLLSWIIPIHLILNIPFILASFPSSLILSSLHVTSLPESLLSHFLTHLPVFVVLSQPHFYSSRLTVYPHHHNPTHSLFDTLSVPPPILVS